MKKFQNNKETRKIGERIRTLRLDAGFSISDIADMTGFSSSLVSKVENGAETSTSHLIEIAKAIGVHPSELFNVPIIVKPRYKLTKKKETKGLITYNLNKLCDETDYFKTPRFVRDIVHYFEEEFGIKTNSIVIAGITRRFVKEGRLKAKKNGRQHLYWLKKKM